VSRADCKHATYTVSWCIYIFRAKLTKFTNYLTNINGRSVHLNLTLELLCDLYIRDGKYLNCLYMNAFLIDNWFGQNLRRNCLLQRDIEGKIKGGLK